MPGETDFRDRYTTPLKFEIDDTTMSGREDRQWRSSCLSMPLAWRRIAACGARHILGPPRIPHPDRRGRGTGAQLLAVLLPGLAHGARNAVTSLLALARSVRPI